MRVKVRVRLRVRVSASVSVRLRARGFREAGVVCSLFQRHVIKKNTSGVTGFWQVLGFHFRCKVSGVKSVLLGGSKLYTLSHKA